MPHMLSMSRARMRVLIAWLVVALVAMQATGLRHAVVHAGRIDTGALATLASTSSAAPAASTSEADVRWSSTVDHSCAAFDAVALAATSTSTVPVLDVVVLPSRRVVPPPSRGIPSPLALAYRSRAPPASPFA